MSFVVYSPFADANDRLACFETSDGNTESDKNRAAKRKMEISEKAKDCLNGNLNSRGYTTDQMFTVESLQLQRLAHGQTANKSNLMALIAHDTAFERQIEAAERCAVIKYMEYDPENTFWKRCATLIEKQLELNAKIASFTNGVKPVSTEGATNNKTKA